MIGSLVEKKTQMFLKKLCLPCLIKRIHSCVNAYQPLLSMGEYHLFLVSNFVERPLDNSKNDGIIVSDRMFRLSKTLMKSFTISAEEVSVYFKGFIHHVMEGHINKEE